MSGKKLITLLQVSLLACPLFFTSPLFAMTDTPSVQVGFSPKEVLPHWFWTPLTVLKIPSE